MKSRRVPGLFLLGVIVVFVVMGCGRVKEAAEFAKNVSDMAEAGRQAAETAEAVEESSTDWENYDITEEDARRFYSAVGALHEKYPEVDFEVAMTAALGAMSEGIDLEEVVEKETELTFEEYSGLSTALMVVHSEAAGLQFTEEIVASMEDGLAQFEDVDESELTEEQGAALEEQRQALAEAKAEMESPEFQARKEKLEMVTAVRDEMGL
jgi:hypothetical protein